MSLSGLSLQPGDRVHLGAGRYTYPLTLAGNGARDCPITLLGTPDGGAVLGAPLDVGVAEWDLRDFSINVPDAGYAIQTTGSGVVDVTFERLSFIDTAVGVTAVGNDIYFVGSSCQSCAVQESRFSSSNSHALYANPQTTGLVFRGNTVQGSADFALQIQAPGAVVDSNDFSGTFYSRVLWFNNAATGNNTVHRNLFHELPTSGLIAVQGGGSIQSNSFVRLNPFSTVADVGDFRDNLVSQAGTVLASPGPADGGYNLYDSVGQVYLDAGPGFTDLTGAAQLDTSFVPLPGSPAVDAADPALPVPPGGGASADVGAFELGATRLPDGRYCVSE
jgi:hypothetical protein